MEKDMKEQSAGQNRNEEKKELLLSYKMYRQKAWRMEEQLKEIRMHKLFPGRILSELPAGTERKDLSDYIVQCEGFIQEIIQARMQAVCRITEVQRSIEAMQDETEKTVLTMKYLRDNKWEEIADKLHIGIRHIHRIHNSALNHFEMKEERCH